MSQEPHDERRALVVEDDEDIRSLIEFTLSTQGFEVPLGRHRPRRRRGGARASTPTWSPSTSGCPGIDGIETCRRIREITDAYVMMITARDDEIDRLLGLETGADDFLSKPFSVRELKARVNALFRRPRRGVGAAVRAGVGAAGARPRCPTTRCSSTARCASTSTVGARSTRADELALTRTEFDLLTELMRTPARVWTREALLRSVWGTEWASDTHLVEVHIGNLRRKLGEGSGSRSFIKTVRGVGYRMESLD